MFNSQVLEIAIGLVFVYLVASLLASVVREFIESILKTRAVQLERGMRLLLDDPSGKQTTAALFGHPQLFALFDGVYDPQRLTGFFRAWKTNKTLRDGNVASSKALRMPLGTHLPSYIPSRNFALALLDMLGRQGADATGAPPLGGRAVSMETLLAHANALAPSRLRDALLVALNEAQGDFDRARTSLEAWFDSNMDRVSGWYKRESQVVLLLIGLLTAGAFNIDTIHITRELASNNTVRAQVVLQAEATRQSINAKAADPKASDPLLDPKALQDAKKGLGDLIGWNFADVAVKGASAASSPGAGASGAVDGASHGTASAAEAAASAPNPPSQADGNTLPTTPWGWGLKLLGMLITALAISLGAPFWFDLLNKMMIVRATVKPFEKSPAEGSEDRAGATPSAERLEPRPGAAAAAGAAAAGPVLSATAAKPKGSVRLAVDTVGLTGLTLTVDGEPETVPPSGLADLSLTMGDDHRLELKATDAAGSAVSWLQSVRVTLDDGAQAIEAQLA